MRMIHREGERPQMPEREEKALDWKKVPQAVEGQLCLSKLA